MRDGAQVNQMNRASNGKWEDLQAFARRSQAGEHAVGFSPRLAAKACLLSVPQETALWASPACGN